MERGGRGGRGRGEHVSEWKKNDPAPCGQDGREPARARELTHQHQPKTMKNHIHVLFEEK